MLGVTNVIRLCRKKIDIEAQYHIISVVKIKDRLIIYEWGRMDTLGGNQQIQMRMTKTNPFPSVILPSVILPSVILPLLALNLLRYGKY